MGNIFDNLGRNTVNISNRTFGYVCLWANSQSSPSITEENLVLYNSPDQTQKKYGFGQTFGGGEALAFNPDSPSIEFRADFFIGLKESVDAKGNEVITLKDINADLLDMGIDYVVRKVVKIHDGKMMLATLVKKR